MFKKILLPYDGSNPSDKAFDYAVKFVNNIKNSAHVTLVYVIPEIHLPPSYGLKLTYLKTTSEYLKESYQSMRSDAISMLEHKKREFEAHVTAGGKITFNIHVPYGRRNPADTILGYACQRREIRLNNYW